MLNNTSYLSAVQYFDFCTDAYITDVIVSPEYQGQGLGIMPVRDILDYIRTNASEGTRISCSLYANKGKEEFYKRSGFEKLPNDKYGFGMILEI